jgi:hypothetical protein
MRAGKLKATGNCFEHSAKYVMDVHPDRNLTLVHCTVTGTGDKVKGIEYSHAFVIEDLGVMMVAIDVTKDDGLENPVVVPLDLYRKIGNVQNEIYYTREEARRECLATRHYGAWDERLQTDADRAVKESR